MALPSDVELVETLGEGSFGVVYVARLKDGAIERTVVLKVLKSDWVDNDDILSRSRDEAALLSRLNHDSIVRVEQLSTLHGRPAVVMEFVRGLTLDRIVKASGAMPVGAALQVLARVAGALDAAYNKIPPGMDKPLRVIHRDIKPSNIILSVNGAVKVLDFGTARGEFSAREAETINVTLGSPRYMAPERFDGIDSGPAVDVYAMGVTFYEILAGRPMGRLSVNPDRQGQQVHQKIDSIRKAHKSGGEQLEELLSIVSDCLDYEPTMRPTAEKLRARCLDLLAQLPGVSITLDRYCETVVEPLYDDRERRPPIPLGDPSRPVDPLDSLASASIRTSSSSSSIVRASTSSLMLAAGGGRWVLLLGLGGMLTAVGGLVALKWSLAQEEGRPISLLEQGPEKAQVLPTVSEGPLAEEEPIPDVPARVFEAEEAAAPRTAAPKTAAPKTAAPKTAAPKTAAPKTEMVNETTEAVLPVVLPVVQSVRKEPRRPQEVRREKVVPRPPPPPTEVHFRVVSVPAGATISIGGRRFTTPAEAVLPSGEYKAKVTYLSGATRICPGLVPKEGEAMAFRELAGGCP
jgi:serine/threonine protein kinase